VEVAEVVGVEHGVQFADAAVAAEAKDRFVLWALAAACPPRAGLDLGDAGAADGAGVAALVPPENSLGDRLPADGVGMLELAHLKVVGRQDSDGVREGDGRGTSKAEAAG